MDSPVAKGLLGVVVLLIIFVYPAVCISRLASRLGKSPVRYGLFSIIPLGSLVALGLLAFSAPPAHGARR